VDDGEARRRVERVEGLLAEIEDDPEATAAVEAVIDLYGEALARLVAGADPVADELVSQLLLVHDLHPVPLETRVRQALDEVRPYLRSHGGDVELLALEDGVARLRLEGSCNGCPSSATTLRLAIEDALAAAAPDLERIDAEGVAEPKPARTPGFVPLGAVQRAAPAPKPGWTLVGQLPGLGEGAPRVEQVAGEPILFAKLGEDVYAYRDRCPGCGTDLGEATLEQQALACAGCGRRYDVRRAGRCLDDGRLSLEPVPLLVDAARVMKVALAAEVA
jgi:Fe-S cluster biogenesis protein NfuA/nitrite reductase/ring-hydroxylating ferredoxin subunit